MLESAFPRPVNPEDEIQPRPVRDVRYLMENIPFVRILGGHFRKRPGEAQTAVQVAHSERGFSGWIAEFGLVVPLRQHHADALRRGKILRQIGGKAVPGVLFERSIVPVAQFGAQPLRNMVARPDLETAGFRAGAHDFALDDRRIVFGKTPDAPAGKVAAFKIQPHRSAAARIGFKGSDDIPVLFKGPPRCGDAAGHRFWP